MHVAIAVLTILASFKWGDWTKFREYHASMFFIATGGLLYEYIVKKDSLWRFHADLLYSNEMTVIIYAVFTMPVSILIFLTHFPEIGFLKKMAYIFLWSAIYIAVEWLLYYFGRISYQNGWTFWYSFLFDLMMFSIIALHQRYPFRAYSVSLVIIIYLIFQFKVPFNFGK